MDGFALNDIPRSGVENMALDQRMLEVAAAESCVLLRVYRWSEPTLSLGYFQPYVQRLTHSHSSDLPVVRRATGGGAIVHHYDWTYSIAVPDRLALGGQVPRSGIRLGAALPLYDCIHDAVIEWLSLQGIAAQRWTQQCAGDSTPAPAEAKHRFLCFERRNCGDIILGDRKVMGSAQRRGRGAMLQHGSLLLATSPYAPSLQGLSPAAALTSQSLLGPFDSSGGSPSELGTSFFEHLRSSLATASGVNLQQVAKLEQTPCQWDWPSSTQFHDPQWTHRL